MHQSSVNSSCAQPPLPLSPPPPATVGHLPALSVRGSGICSFCTARGPGICQPRGHSRAFDTYVVSYQNITTQKVLVEKKQIGSSVKGRNKLKRVVKVFSRFYACISSLLHYVAKTGAIDVNQGFFGLLNQISVDIIWRTSFHSYKTIHNI